MAAKDLMTLIRQKSKPRPLEMFDREAVKLGRTSRFHEALLPANQHW